MPSYTQTKYETALLPSAARTTTQTFDDLLAFNAKALEVILDLTAFTTAASLTVTIDLKDPNSGKYINILTGAAIVANGTQRLRISPHLAAVANQVANDHVPATFRITVTHGNANSHTYSLTLIRHGE